MIGDNEHIESMLDNIARQVSIIQNDFYANGEVHYNYILEKLGRAKMDLDGLVLMATDYKERAEKNGRR